MDKILLDTSYIYAVFDTQEPKHTAAYKFAQHNRLPLVMPDVVLVEAAFFFRRAGGVPAVVGFLDRLMKAGIQFEPVTLDDLARIRNIMHTYADAKLDITDCCIMALAERLHITRVATFDRRDFAIFRPTHCDTLELLP